MKPEENENEKKFSASKNLQYYISVKCDDGSSIQISKKISSYEAALALYQKILDALRSDSTLQLIEVNDDE